MNNSVAALRRWFGMFFLAVAAGMLIWGHTILLPYLKGVGFVLYWLLCFLFTFASIVVALLDARAVLQSVKRERAALFQRALKEIEQDAAARDERPDTAEPAPK
jgi:hypothetical protein